jgi:CDP-diacylglycerol---serine O-phosphatidyltransferase
LHFRIAGWYSYRPKERSMKAKDFVTLGNLLGGFGAVIALFVIPDPWRAFQWSCYLIFIGYVFDVLDGPIARLLKQQTKFGGHFDTVCDYITNSICPGFILFHFYWKIGHVPWLLAAIIGAFPVTLGTIRQAQGMERGLSYPCYWIGLPRPVLTLFVLALLNSSSMWFGICAAHPWREVWLGATALLIVVMSFMHLSNLPFLNHSRRRWMKVLRFGMHMFLTMVPIVAALSWILFRQLAIVYDFILFDLIIYIFISWTQNPKEDLRRIKAYVNGGPLVRPLVHVDNDWRPKTGAVYFLEDGERERQSGQVVLEQPKPV